MKKPQPIKFKYKKPTKKYPHGGFYEDLSFLYKKKGS